MSPFKCHIFDRILTQLDIEQLIPVMLCQYLQNKRILFKACVTPFVKLTRIYMATYI
jgi:hypothetical protein